jgi:hypothetical protein
MTAAARCLCTPSLCAGFQDPHGVLKLLHGPQVSKSVRALYGVMSGDKDIESGLAHDGRKATASVKLGTTEDVVAALVDGTVDIADPQERNHAICFSCEYVKVGRCPRRAACARRVSCRIGACCSRGTVSASCATARAREALPVLRPLRGPSGSSLVRRRLCAPCNGR